MKDKSVFSQKVKVITKLIDSGYVNEKKLQQLNIEGILKIPGITIPEMTIILEIQKQTKANKLYSYLSGHDESAVNNGEGNNG